MDAIDHQLLDLLQADSRQSTARLAERTGSSASACWRRVKALEEAGVIARYSAVVDPARMGLRFEAIVQVHLARHDAQALNTFIAALHARDEVVECVATTGQADYHLRVICRDIEAYNDFLETFLFRQGIVHSAQTGVILRRIKTDAPVRGRDGDGRVSSA